MRSFFRASAFHLRAAAYGICSCTSRFLEVASRHASIASHPADHRARIPLQVKRLKMYNSGKAVRNKAGRIVSQELQSKELPSTRIVPDRRWFGNTRVIGQKQLSSFREQMADKADNPFMVLLKERKLPLQARPVEPSNTPRRRMMLACPGYTRTPAARHATPDSIKDLR
jgi:NGP1NT (NUC091) domain